MSARRFLIPEVVQSSGMDCGPAALKSLFDGFGISVRYDHLRDACQTDVDGTSVDALEVVAQRLGLAAEQVLVPVDHVLLPEARLLPALAVVRTPSGAGHFVVVWSCVAGWVQVMDPAVGRRWMRAERFLAELYRHEMAVPAQGLLEFVQSEEFREPLSRRLSLQGAERSWSAAMLTRSAAQVLRLDAALRCTEELVQARAVSRKEAPTLLRELAEGESVIPDSCWLASSLPDAEGAEQADGAEPEVLLRGAVLLRISAGAEPAQSAPSLEPAAGPPLPAEASALQGTEAQGPWRLAWQTLWSAGPRALLVSLGLAALAGGAALLEPLALRAALELGHLLPLPSQRTWALGALGVLLLGLIGLDLASLRSLSRLGRSLDLRLRARLLGKLPRLSERYFSSRPPSDLSERAQSAHRVRKLPELLGQALKLCAQLVAVCAGLCWLSPSHWPLVLAALACAVAAPLIGLRGLSEPDLRLRAHTGALARFYFDALLGVVPIRSHRGEAAMRRQQEMLLVEWARTQRELVARSGLFQAAQGLLGAGWAVWLFSLYARAHGAEPGALLFLYWCLELPVLGEQLAAVARLLPAQRSLLLRLEEPLEAPTEDLAEDAAAEAVSAGEASETPARGVAISLREVSLSAAGVPILRELALEVAPGEQIAVVGRSGAGKSSLIGLLLGLAKPSGGELLIDGEKLTSAAAARLRLHTAWVDPAAQIWNRSILDNLQYGDFAPERLAGALEDADLLELLERLPKGLQTPAGEGGGLLSGGEGQRVRLGRALSRRQARLVLLDEPFRGMDAFARRRLLSRARASFEGATLLCVTHDIEDTLGFPRVLVIEEGRLVEDGAPLDLSQDPASTYAQLLRAQRAARDELWADPCWRRLSLRDGELDEAARAPAPEDRTQRVELRALFGAKGGR